MISIIIPTREEEKYIGATLEYIRRSLTLPHEIIISDGKSSDRTVEVARSLADHVLMYEGAKHNPGIGRNDGARVARGEYYLFLDADSRISNMDASLRALIARFEADPSLDAFAGPQWVEPSRSKLIDKLVFGIDNAQNRARNNLLKRGWGCGKALFVRRSAYERVGGFHEQLVFGEDWNFMERIAKTGKTRFDSHLTVYHSGRRLHKYGLAKFWGSWAINGIYVALFDHAYVDEWTPVR